MALSPSSVQTEETKVKGEKHQTFFIRWLWLSVQSIWIIWSCRHPSMSMVLHNQTANAQQNKKNRHSTSNTRKNTSRHETRLQKISERRWKQEKGSSMQQCHQLSSLWSASVSRLSSLPTYSTWHSQETPWHAWEWVPQIRQRHSNILGTDQPACWQKHSLRKACHQT